MGHTKSLQGRLAGLCSDAQSEDHQPWNEYEIPDLSMLADLNIMVALSFEFHSQPDNMRGYEKLAHFVTTNRGLELYRRFGWLQTLNLLYLQAHLTDLEAQLRNTIEEDLQSSDTDRTDLVLSWKALERSKEDPALNIQYNLILEARKTLDAYCTIEASLLRQE